MANNRMWIVCTRCEPGPVVHGDPASPRRLLAKYYPSAGWSEVEHEALALQRWLEFHTHGEASFFGPVHFRLEFEAGA